MADFLKNILMFLVVGILIGVVGILILKNGETNQINNSQNTTQIIQTKAELEIITINPSICSICRSTEGINLYVSQSAQRDNFSISAEKTINFPDSQTNELVRKYKIDRLPAVIIRATRGEIPQSFTQEFESYLGSVEADGVLVMRNVDAPYLNTSQNKIVGIVEGTAIYKQGCEKCLDPAKYFQALEGEEIGIVFSTKDSLEVDTPKASELIAKYNITKFPALILSEEAYEYGAFNQYIANAGEKIQNKFVIKQPIAPFFDLSQNKTVGLVDALIINPVNCANCTNISGIVGGISVQGGIVLDQTREIYENETDAREIITRLNITKLPTLILSDEMKYYLGLEEEWIRYGNSIEENGSYVLRSPESLSLNWTHVNMSSN